MRSLLVLGILATCIGIASADDETAKIPLATPSAGAAQPATQQPPPGIVPVPAWSPRPQRPHPTATAAAVAAEVAAENKTGDPSVQFSAEALWDLAGYNNDEVIYTIFITSHDPRILRCTTELKGAYYENGEKHSVSDRQSTTVFPEQRTTAGNWQGMDQSSGATYSVKCHPV
jgi:hypothetical protein